MTRCHQAMGIFEIEKDWYTLIEQSKALVHFHSIHTLSYQSINVIYMKIIIVILFPQYIIAQNFQCCPAIYILMWNKWVIKLLKHFLQVTWKTWYLSWIKTVWNVHKNHTLLYLNAILTTFHQHKIYSGILVSCNLQAYETVHISGCGWNGSSDTHLFGA